MIYFSELKGKRVCTEDNIDIGYLEDLIFLVSQNPKITKIVVRDKNNNRLLVPIEYLRKINSCITINKDFNVSVLQENELHIMRNLLDKQIIDLVGSKIVRVNDVALQDTAGGLYLAGVDISLMAILRWIGLERIVHKVWSRFGKPPSSRFLSWADIQPLELAHGHVKLKIKADKLAKIKPEDLADYLEQTNVRNVRKILGILDDDLAAQVIGDLNINYQASLFRNFEPKKAAELISLIDPDEAVDILLTSTKKRREEILSYLNLEKRKELNYLLSLSKTPIGDIMTTEYLAVDSNNTVGEALSEIKRNTTDFSFLYYIYVINQQKQIVGVFNLHELLLHDFDTPVYKFMIQNVVVAHLTSAKETTLKKMLKYNIFMLPVIDTNKHILGVISFDSISDFTLSSLK